MAIPEQLRNLKFDLADCIIDVARQAEKGRPVLYGVTNGEVDYADNPGQDLETIMNRVTVTHIPTKLSVTVDKFLPSRNRTIAIELLKRQVEQKIAELIKMYESSESDAGV